MLIIELGGEEVFNEESGKFMQCKKTTVRLEHSLISVSKWESIHQKPFIPKSPTEPQKTKKELYSYVKCMVIGDISEEALSILWYVYGNYINDYIHSKSTATIITRNDSVKSFNQPFITSELIYYWMIMYSIPFEAQRWHLNRLLTLIDICNVKNSTSNKKSKGKLSKSEMIRRRNALNRERRSAINSMG